MDAAGRRENVWTQVPFGSLAERNELKSNILWRNYALLRWPTTNSRPEAYAPVVNGCAAPRLSPLDLQQYAAAFQSALSASLLPERSLNRSCRKEINGVGKTLEVVFAAIREADVGACDQVLDRAGYEALARPSEPRYAGG
jgi:hypothetical protein